MSELSTEYFPPNYVSINFEGQNLTPEASKFLVDEITAGRGVLFGPVRRDPNSPIEGFYACSPDGDLHLNGELGINWHDVEFRAKLKIGREFLGED